MGISRQAETQELVLRILGDDAVIADGKELDAARLLVMRAAWMKDRGERAAREVAIAKMTATESAAAGDDGTAALRGGVGLRCANPTCSD